MYETALIHLDVPRFNHNNWRRNQGMKRLIIVLIVLCICMSLFVLPSYGEGSELPSGGKYWLPALLPVVVRSNPIPSVLAL